MKHDSSSIEYRELRRTDLPSFEKVMLQGLGVWEQATGLGEASVVQFKSFRNRGVWALFVFMRAMGRAPIRIFVGVDRQQVLGTASILLFQNTGYIVGVVTDGAARGRGIATHLLERAHVFAQRRGKSWVVLDVDSENANAIRVYRRLGYEERARFRWYVGPTPAPGENSAGTATMEVHWPEMTEVAAWVDRSRPSAIRDPMPATGRRLSHFETITRMPRSPVRTWRLTSSGQTAAVVRGSYLSLVQTGYVIPAAWDSALPGESLLSLVTPVLGWFRSLGARRTVVVIPDPPGTWEPVMASLGLQVAVSSILMARPIVA
jgi:ribosomal protein S18 acetylase RimI-like enzyme